MFTFEEVERGRVKEGPHASEEGENCGHFIIPLAKHITVQAKTWIEPGWEILEAEQVQKLPPRGRIIARAMPIGLPLLKDLKRWFWGIDQSVILAFPPEKPDMITTRPYVAYLLCPTTGSETFTLPAFML